MKILIIGLGSIALKHVQAIREILPQSMIYALRSLAKSEEYPNIHNIFSLKDLKINPDFIIISNPSRLHEKTIFQVLNFGCPLFIEKPALSDLKNASSIIEKVKEKKIITYVACNLRFHPVIEFLKQYLYKSQPRINEVNVYCGSYLPDWRPGLDFRTTYSANGDMGGGVHLDLIHELDYCVWLFGMPFDVSSLKRNVSSLSIHSIDFAQYNLSYPHFTANIVLNYYRKDLKRQIEIVTNSDTLLIDLVKNQITSNLSGEVQFEGPFQMAETYLKQMHYFIQHIRVGQQPMNAITEGIEVLKLALHD